jgi:hypothetical protein
VVQVRSTRYKNQKYIGIFWPENANGSHLSGDAGADGRIILKWILNRVKGCERDSSGSG